MNNAILFKQAHAMTKASMQAGDNYQATFALCLKLVIEQNKAQAVAMVESKGKAHMNRKSNNYAADVGALYETLQNKLVLTSSGYYAGVRIGHRVSNKHRHIAKLVRYHMRAQYGMKFKPRSKFYN